MTALPRAVRDWLVDGPQRLAWVRLEAGRVAAVGGATMEHGLDRLGIGEPLPAEVPWAVALEGPLPLELHAVARAGGAVARSDVRAWEAPGGAVFVVLTDSSAQAELVGAALQRENEGDLLRERLAGSERLRLDERRTRALVLGALGYELLEEGPDGRFRPPGSPQPWLLSLAGAADGPVVLDGSDPTEFLSAFLGDAAEFLAERRARGAPGLRSSGIWTQRLAAGGDGEGATEGSFEAHALALPGGRGVVAVERLAGAAAQERDALQRQRDAELSFERLEREVQLKDILLHCIVHDLRGPLSGLVGSLSLLEKGGLAEDERRQVIAIGLRQARRQDEMIREVLDVFAAEYDALRSFEEDPSTAPDLVAVATECVERLGPAFRSDEVSLVLDAPDGPLPVAGRADRLERVLANLLGNARRHAPAGSTVEVVLRRVAGGATLEVADRGPGVPEALAERLFDRFVQGGSGAGTVGLGLYYVAMTVRRWGGGVAHEPRPGGGALFRVTLRSPGAPA